MNTAELPQNSVNHAPRADEAVTRLRASEIFRDYQQAFQTATGLPLVLRAAGSFQEPLHGGEKSEPVLRGDGVQEQELRGLPRTATARRGHVGESAVTLECFAGLSESLVPVRQGERIIAFLQTGQVLLHAPNENNSVRPSPNAPKKWNATVRIPRSCARPSSRPAS